MDAAELAYAGIALQAELLTTGQVGARELLDVYLTRIERYDACLNAFRVVFAEHARAEAEKVDAHCRGSSNRPLLGVPIAIKDDVDVRGEVTAFGTNAFGDPAQEDAEIVRRLREAGAIIVGKTNVPELQLWPFTETASFGATRNPWQLQRAAGGSSGGSAAAVAAGLVGAALGSDGAGSIRIPAAWCGLFGLKPQRGRVSTAPRTQLWHGLVVNGVLTRRVADTALFHDAVSKSTSVRATGPTASFLRAAARSPGRLKIAYSRRVPFGVASSADQDAERVLEETVEMLRSLGHTLNEQDPDYGTKAIPNVFVRYMRGAYDEAQTLAHPDRLERRTRGMVRLGQLVPPILVKQALTGERALMHKLNGVLEDHDVLLTPTTATGPPRVGQFQGRGALRTMNAVAGMVPYNSVWNMTGQPAASVPMGRDSDGLPRGVQLVASPHTESTLLSLAGQLECERKWTSERPQGFP